ncbi:hypothetical protein NL676_021197 [Syzygium grande]|nr:hypothetical protein NL676_021197 [Syzygium grande]
MVGEGRQPSPSPRRGRLAVGVNKPLRNGGITSWHFHMRSINHFYPHRGSTDPHEASVPSPRHHQEWAKGKSERKYVFT